MAEYKDITKLKKQIAHLKKSISSPNSDYMTGYISALSVTEGMIAGLPIADVVEVVRCKDCEAYEEYTHCKNMGVNGFCNYGFRTPPKGE